ncbi:MAG: sigma-70 family RNA polymerase sigma factor [Gemmatimonadota bacterium]|nr:sigma-70 family RNA polymerase sigma factor [Gemmatimonadota bacterium]MDH3421909.1 sigma-70 family RNA polymerase sigma factor [Gemmatimonadota bacterium]
MHASEFTPAELEAQLAALHTDSFGWTLSCCGWDESDAEDVLQTTYVKVISGRARFGGRSTFRTWLFGVIRQTAREYRRRARSHVERAEKLAQEPTARGRAVPQPDEVQERAERSRTLLKALDQLPDRQREVMHLVFYQDLTIREAAEVMEVSLGSARVHYERGKKRLRGLLSPEDVGGGTP